MKFIIVSFNNNKQIAKYDNQKLYAHINHEWKFNGFLRTIWHIDGINFMHSIDIDKDVHIDVGTYKTNKSINVLSIDLT